MGIKYGRGWRGARISLSRGSVLSREYFPFSLYCAPPPTEDRVRITKQSPVPVYVGRVERKCFQKTRTSSGRPQQLQLWCRHLAVIAVIYSFMLCYHIRWWNKVVLITLTLTPSCNPNRNSLPQPWKPQLNAPTQHWLCPNPILTLNN